MPTVVKTLLASAVGLAVLGAVLVVGLRQADESQGPGADRPTEVLTGADILPALAKAPAPLAGLHKRGGELRGSGPGAFTQELRALRGYPVVVNVWAAWCAPCKREFPLFQQASKQLGTRVGFLGVNYLDNADDARALLRRFFVPYPSIEDPKGLIRDGLGRVAGLPVTVFYTADGTRNHIHQGEYSSLEDLTSDIERYAVRG